MSGDMLRDVDEVTLRLRFALRKATAERDEARAYLRSLALAVMEEASPVGATKARILASVALAWTRDDAAAVQP